MANHVTRQIMDALQTLLAGAGTLAGVNVYTGRVTPLRDTELPAILIESSEEALELLTVHAPYVQQREIQIDVHCVIKRSDGYDADAYQLLLEVEHAIAGAPTLSGLCSVLVPTGVDTEHVGEADRPLVRKTLRVRAAAEVMNNAVDTPL